MTQNFKVSLRITSTKSSTNAIFRFSSLRYVVKMCYMWMLGYEVDFGHMEVINLISGLKLSEKAIGYFATTLFIHQNDD